MNDPRPSSQRPRRRRTARVTNSRWTEPILVATAFLIAALCYFLVERLDLASWRHGDAAIMFVIVPPGLFLILTYDRLSGLLDRWLAKKDDRPSSDGD